MSRYGGMNTYKSPDETKADIRETMRKWRDVQDFEILPNPKTYPPVAVVEFWVGGAKRTLRCQRFGDFRDNLRAVYLTLESLRLAHERGILRELAEAAAGLLAAPKTGRPAHEVLGVFPQAPLEVAEAAYKVLAKTAHPDMGGSDEAMAELNEAIEEFRAR